MVVFYKHFYPARTAIWALFACFLFAAPHVQAKNSLFTVENIEIDVTAGSALVARDQAFVEAQGKAFGVLAGRMLSETELATFTPPESSVVSTFVQDYEVTKEQLSHVRYVGTYTFRFKDKAVQKYFSGSGVQYTNVASRPVLILPYYQLGEKMVLWSPYNAWMQAWNRAGDMSGIVPVTVPLGDIQDVRDIGDDNALTYDKERLRAMLQRYGVGEAVLVVATPDESLSLVASDSDPAVGSITIHIYRTDRESPEYVTQIIEKSRSGQTKADMLNIAVKKVHKALQKDWKKKTLISSVNSNVLRVRVPFNNLEQWVNTRKALGYVNSIDQIVVKSLSPKSAQIELLFQGSESRLRLALQQVSMTLSRPRFSISGLSAGINADKEPLVYDLYLNSYARTERQF